ncbi:hypothetical protein VE01_09664 [Pseudogymnoascus verrucosus]|uniref:Uncharacterized protein n=1 Tax=Pseudogymnoascus verrucosus TaxID=342668 RepID=A0A1B8G9Q1_9PEZI|nr:uncharacterized protein VE01_09664 [Pseudogymnoascus verrucosus]OBT92562.1 hypothetical protein VE01_09664 [Pseudogymnoascus verrucosus]
MCRWAEMTSRCARWFSSYWSLESLLLVGAIADIYTFASLSIYFYCLSGSVDPSSRLSVCHYNYTAQSQLTRWTSCVTMLVRAICSTIELFVFVSRMRRAKRTRERLDGRHTSLLELAADKLYTKTEIDSLVIYNEALVKEQNAILVEQHAVLVDLAAWVSKVSAWVTPLSDSMASKGNEQAGEEASPLEMEQQQALVEQLATLVSKLTDLASKQVNFEATKKNEQTARDRLRTETLVEERLAIEREKIETEKAKLQEERESLEAEKEALKAKAKKLGIVEDKLRTTTPEEFQKLIDAQEKLRNDLNKLHDELETPSNDKGGKDIAKLGRDFRAKTRETFFLMAANDKLVYEAWDLLDSMGSITPELKIQGDYNDYCVRTVAMYLAEHMLEENKTDKGPQVEEPHAKEELQEEKRPLVLEVTEDLPEVRTHLGEEDEEPREKAVLQVQDGLQ